MSLKMMQVNQLIEILKTQLDENHVLKIEEAKQILSAVSEFVPIKKDLHIINHCSEVTAVGCDEEGQWSVTGYIMDGEINEFLQELPDGLIDYSEVILPQESLLHHRDATMNVYRKIQETSKERTIDNLSF